MYKKGILLKVTLIVLTSYFLILSLVEAQNFLAPLLTAFIMALIILPFVQKLEKKLSRSFAALIGTIVLFIFSLGIVLLISLQVQNFVKDWPQIKEKMVPKIEQLKSYATQNTFLSEDDFKSGKQDESVLNSSLESNKTAGYLSSITAFIGNYLLCFIYIYFLLCYRRKFKRFLIRIFPDEKEDQVRVILQKSISVAPQYMIGKLILMGILAVLYAIGLGISGIDNFILISLLASLLTLIPYIGNIIGILIAIALGYVTSGEISVLIGIIATFSIAQFVESYILEPYVVGDRVDLHPFVVILVVVIGNMLWGVIGMVIAIPLMAIISVVFLHIPLLRPYGILLSNNKFDENES